MNDRRKELLGQGKACFSQDAIKKYEGRYFELLEKGRRENKSTSHKYAKQEEKALLNRMEKYSHNHLLLLYDFSVPFDDNISERDLRKAKNRQKMVGGFRKSLCVRAPNGQFKLRHAWLVANVDGVKMV